MNWEQIQGKWQEYKGMAKQRWGKLTDNDLMVINGRRDVLAGKIAERSGAAKEQIEKEIAEFEASCCTTAKPAAKAAVKGVDTAAEKAVKKSTAEAKACDATKSATKKS